MQIALTPASSSLAIFAASSSSWVMSSTSQSLRSRISPIITAAASSRLPRPPADMMVFGLVGSTFLVFALAVLACSNYHYDDYVDVELVYLLSFLGPSSHLHET